MKRINIKDLAKILSLNASTISRALNDHPDISKETKDRVRSTAELYNYIPNLHAKYFRQKNSRLIALILPEFNMFFTNSLMDGINKVLEKEGYTLLIFYSNNSKTREIEIVRHCISWVVEGVLMVMSDYEEEPEHLNELKQSEIPIVLIDKVKNGTNHNTVTINDQEAAYLATSHLLNKDIFPLLGIFSNKNLSITKNRVLGFKEALLKKNKLIENNDIKYITNLPITSEVADLNLQNYKGVFIMSDELLSNVYPILIEKSLYPAKISIISISDGKLPYLLHPKVNHILHSGTSIGETSANLLLKIIKTTAIDTQNILVATHTVILN